MVALNISTSTGRSAFMASTHSTGFQSLVSASEAFIKFADQLIRAQKTCDFEIIHAPTNKLCNIFPGMQNGIYPQAAGRVGTVCFYAAAAPWLE